MTRAALVCTVTLGVYAACAGLALAQRGPTAERLRSAEDLEARCGGVVRVRWDAETGAPANLSFTEALPLGGASPEEAATRWLRCDLAPLFEGELAVVSDARFAPAAGPALILKGTRNLGGGRVRVDFDQYSGPVQVLDAGVSIEIAAVQGGLAPVAVRARYHPSVPADMGRSCVMPADANIQEAFTPVQVGDLIVDPSFARRVVPVNGCYRLACVVRTVLPETGETWNPKPVSPCWLGVSQCVPPRSQARWNLPA